MLDEKIKIIESKVLDILRSNEEVNKVRDELSLDLVNDLAKSFMKYFIF